MVLVFDLTNVNLLCQSLRREKNSLHCLYFFFRVCMTTLFLKWSNTANFIRVERRGGRERWEERLICICIWSGKCKWTKMIWQEENVNSSLQLFADKKKKKKCFFLFDRPFHSSTKCHSIRHLINHHGSILKFLMIFSNRSEQQIVCFVWDFTCFLLQKNQCQ